MIQRVQSLLLLLTMLLAVLFPVGIIMRFSEGLNEIVIRFAGLAKTSGGEGYEIIEKALPFSGLMVIIPLLSFIIIFLYKNRKLQVRLTGLLIILIICLIIAMAYYIVYIGKTYNAELIPNYKLVLPFIMLVSSFLARRYIRKDEDLVRSYDRLR